MFILRLEVEQRYTAKRQPQPTKRPGEANTRDEGLGGTGYNEWPKKEMSAYGTSFCYTSSSAVLFCRRSLRVPSRELYSPCANPITCAWFCMLKPEGACTDHRATEGDE